MEWVSRKDLNSFVERKMSEGCTFSPWFAKMQEHGLLESWWEIVEKGKLADAGA